MGNTEYDYSGVRTVTVKAPNSTKVIVLNEDGNVKSTSINGKSVQYNDWPTGEVYTATPEGGSAVETHFDMKGNRILLNDPDAGLRSTTYNGFGDVLSQENRGRNDEEIINTIYSYDEETGLVDYVTENGIVTDYGYDEEFRLETISIDDLHSKTFEYDRFNRVTKIAENIEGNKSFTESIIYDDCNRVVKNIYPSGYSISYNYNKHSELFSVSDKDKYTIWTAKESNANGQYTKTLKGGLECTYNYDNRSLPELISAYGIVNMTYVFDKNVRLESRTDHISNNAEEFSYDTKGRLQSWTVKRTNEDPISNSIIYEPTTGNIKSKSDIQYIMNYGENDFGPHAITSINGKPASFSDEEQFIEYTSFKKVSKITVGSNELNIVYGIDKQRRKSVFSGGLTRYYFNNYEEDYSGNNVKKVHYITGGNGITAMYIETNGVGQLYHLITDYQGSLIAIANKDGEIASFDGSEQKFAYDPWGNRRNPNDWKLIDTRTKWLSDRGYAMHEHLDGFTLINMNGRVYDPMLAQFLSPDPYIQSPDNWLNYNRYTYCLNNPMLYTDPSGEFFGAALPLMVKIGIGIGAAVGGYTGYKIGEANGASGLGMAAYMLGGAAIGGFSGYVGGTVAAGGGIMANTGAIMAGSYTNSMGMAMLSGGDMPPSISFGAGSFNFGTGEFRSIFDWKDLSTMEKIGYGLGALANLNDLINQTSATLYTQERYPDGSKDIISHSGIVDDASTDKLMSFGPNDSKIGAGGFKDQVGGLKPGGGYKKFGLAIRKSTTGYDVPVSLSKFQSVVVNKHLFSGLRGISKIIPYQGATTNCVNMSSIGFWLNGIPNIGIHPYLLHYSTAAYYGGFRPDIFSYYLNNN